MKKTITAIIAALTVNAVTGQGTPAQVDLAAIESGETVVFDGSGHAKSKGLEFSIKVPKSWAMKEGDRPNIVQKFRSENGTGSAQFVIITKSLEQELSQEDLKEFYGEESMKEMFSELGTYIRSNSITLENLPAGYCEYKLTKQRLDNTFFAHCCSFVVCWKTTMIQFQYIVANHGMTADQAAVVFAEYLPVFRSITNSFVLTSKWK
jgi:hypothetical protein